MFFLVLLAFGGFSMAQTIENFEYLKMNLMMGDAATDQSTLKVIANPDSTAVDSSNYVVEFKRDKDGVVHEGFYATLEKPLNLTANKYVHVKVWKPRVSKVTFKLEGTTTLEKEPMTAQTMTNAWEELVFDFSTLTGDYTKIVFSPDRVETADNTEDITMYFDELFINNNPAVGSKPVQMIEDYEIIPLNPILNATNDASSFTWVPNPDKSPLNPSDNVIKFLRDKDGMIWDGFYSRLVTDAHMDSVDVTTNKYVHVKVWKPRISVVKFKLEGGKAGTLEIPSINPQTKVNEWEDLVFDFTSKTGKYPIIGLLPDFSDPVNLTEDITIYFDDIIVNNIATALEPAKQVINVDMRNSGYTPGSKVWISGSFGGDRGTWAVPGTVPQNEMLDPDGDGIYTITLNLPDGAYEYKFFWGNAWDHGDETAGNRTVNVNGNSNLTYVWGVKGTTGTKVLAGTSFKVFPNPVKDMLTLQFAQMKNVVITDIMGRTVKNVNLEGINSKNVNLNDLKSGLYFISVETNAGVYSSKFIKE
jgi:hypothetical protein